MSGVSRFIVRVLALLPADWRGKAGRRFTQTVDLISETVREVSPDAASVPNLVAEGTRRLTVGGVSRAHAEVVRNYAEEERAKIETVFAQRTLEDRIRQEHAKADQEESRAKKLRTEELLARMMLLEKLRAMGFVLVRDVQGNLELVRGDVRALDQASERLLKLDEIDSAIANTLISDESD